MPLPRNTYQTFPANDYVDLVPYQYGREYCHPGHTFGPATRNHYLFHYVISGKGTLVSQDEQNNTVTHNLHGGQGFMIFPHQVNTYMADDVDPWVYTWIEFDGVRVGDLLELAGLTPATPTHKPSSEGLRALLEQEMLFFATHPEAPALQLIGHLYLFMDALVRSTTTAPEALSIKPNDVHVQSALQFIDGNFGKNIAVADIARSADLNPSYFGKLFKEVTGKTPQQYLIGYRMAKATDLLKFTSMSIAEVGAAVGYPNQLHFSRAFKNVHGLSPREWRKQNARLAATRMIGLRKP